MKQHKHYPNDLKLAIHHELGERLKQAEAIILDLTQIAARLGSPEHRAVQAARRAYKNFFTLRAGMEAIFCENFPWALAVQQITTSRRQRRRMSHSITSSTPLHRKPGGCARETALTRRSPHDPRRYHRCACP